MVFANRALAVVHIDSSVSDWLWRLTGFHKPHCHCIVDLHHFGKNVQRDHSFSVNANLQCKGGTVSERGVRRETI